MHAAEICGDFELRGVPCGCHEPRQVILSYLPVAQNDHLAHTRVSVAYSIAVDSTRYRTLLRDPPFLFLNLGSFAPTLRLSWRGNYASHTLTRR